MLDDFLKEKPPQLDLSESATNAERDEMPQPTLTPASTGSRAYVGNWRQEAETFRQGVGREDNNMMLTQQLGFELAQLKALYVVIASDTHYRPNPGWRDMLIQQLKQQLKWRWELAPSQTVLEQTSDVQGAANQRLELTMLKMLEEGNDVNMVDCVRGLPPALSPDGAWPDPEDVAEVSLFRRYESSTTDGTP